MTISLQDAIERAKLVADNGIIKQSFYNLLVNQVDDTDVHPLTMALVENGIMVRTGSSVFDKKFLEANRLSFFRDPGDNIDEFGNEEEKTEGTTSDGARDVIEVLENAGISISKDGMVSFYSANLPGIFKDKLPQSIPLGTAIEIWEQKLNNIDRERERTRNIQDALSRLKTMLDERVRTGKSPTIGAIESALTELESYGFDPRSKVEMTRDISRVIEEVFDRVMSSNWINSVKAVDEAQNLLEEYISNQIDNYENDLYVWDAMNELNNLKESDPDTFEESIGGVGGLAARLYASYMRKSFDKDIDFEMITPSEILVLNINRKDFDEYINSVVNKLDINDTAENISEMFVYNTIDWIEEVVPILMEQEDVYEASDILIDFSDQENYGVFEDEFGNPIYDDSWEGGKIQKQLDNQDANALVDIVNEYVYERLKKDKHFFE